jgi:uncharacterized protein (DUF1778 family)
MGEKTTAKVTMLLTPADKRRLKEMARADSRNVSDFMRKLVREAIAEYEQRIEQGGK